MNCHECKSFYSILYHEGRRFLCKDCKRGYKKLCSKCQIPFSDFKSGITNGEEWTCWDCVIESHEDDEDIALEEQAWLALEKHKTKEPVWQVCTVIFEEIEDDLD